MKENIFEKIKSKLTIEEVVRYFGVSLNSSNKGKCPFHEEKTPSFSINKRNNLFKCFGCGESGDVISFVVKLKNIEPIDAATMLADIFHINISESEQKNKKSKIIQKNDKEIKENKSTLQDNKKKIKQYLLNCISNCNKTNYFSSRGFTETTIKKYCLGYDVEKKQIIIPYSSKLEYYQARSIIDKSFFKPKTEDAGLEPLYNKEALYNKSTDKTQNSTHKKCRSPKICTSLVLGFFYA